MKGSEWDDGHWFLPGRETHVLSKRGNQKLGLGVLGEQIQDRSQLVSSQAANHAWKKYSLLRVDQGFVES